MLAVLVERIDAKEPIIIEGEVEQHPLRSWENPNVVVFCELCRMG